MCLTWARFPLGPSPALTHSYDPDLAQAMPDIVEVIT